MSEERTGGDKITVRDVREGNRQGDCDPKAVRIEFKESNTIPGEHMAFLCSLLESHGYEVTEGAGIEGTLFRCLCVTMGERQVRREEVLNVLRTRKDKIDLPDFDKEG